MPPFQVQLAFGKTQKKPRKYFSCVNNVGIKFSNQANKDYLLQYLDKH